LSLLRGALFALCLIALPVQLGAAPARKLGPRPAGAPVAARDWSKMTTRLPTGAFVLGNPGARIKVVEYLSLTCPHCAHFEGEAIAPLTAKYIRPGLVSYEVRHALRDSFDYAGSLLVRCDGPQTYFTRLPQIFAQQDKWFARAQAWSQVEQAEGLPADQLLPKAAAGAGFDSLLGLSAARMNECIARKDEQAVLTAMASEAWHRPDFPGTPAFLINGELKPDVRTWADLDAALATALHPHPSPRKTGRQ
jgi:protein-disulfide isomerase